MSTEIRPVRPEETEDYLRVLPQETGLPMWEAAPAAWHTGQGFWTAPAVPNQHPVARSAAAVGSDGFRSQAAGTASRPPRSAFASLFAQDPAPYDVAGF